MTAPHSARAVGDALRARFGETLLVLGLLSFGLLAGPLHAQTPAASSLSVGFLGPLGPVVAAPLLRALDDGLRELGYVEGRNLVYERRFAEGKLERLPDLAAELVRSRVDVLIGSSNPAIAALQRATTTRPIVMTNPTDPVGAGFVRSLARPGSNLTGLSMDAGPEILAKRLQMLKEINPRLSRVGVPLQAGYGTGAGLAALRAAAPGLGVTLQVVEFSRLDEIEGAFQTLVRGRAEAVIPVGVLTWERRPEIANLALKHRLPSVGALREYAEAGYLFAYGPRLADLFRRAARYVARIHQGARPGDLPVEQPTKFELVVNLRTAKALGMAIPPAVLAQADEVIR